MKAYNGLFIFSTSIKEEALTKAVERVRDEIGKLTGSIHQTQMIGRQTFARPLKRQDAGQYVKISFSMGPENIDSLLARLKLNEDIFRVQITRSDGITRADGEGKEVAQDDRS